LFKDDVELAQFLFEHGADATAQDGRGSTPLHNATSGDMWD
jgi:ankyrin repeat protein